jgi:hypothetical protein
MFLILLLQLQFDTTTTSGGILDFLFGDLEPTQEIIRISDSISKSVLSSFDTMKTENWEGDFAFKLRLHLSRDKRIQNFCKEEYIEGRYSCLYVPPLQDIRRLNELRDERRIVKEVSEIKDKELKEMVESYLRRAGSYLPYQEIFSYSVKKALLTLGAFESTLGHPDHLSWFEKKGEEWFAFFLLPKIEGDSIVIVQYTPDYFEKGYIIVKKVSEKKIVLDKDFYLYKTPFPPGKEKEIVMAYIMANISNPYDCIIWNKYGDWIMNILYFELPEKYIEQWTEDLSERHKRIKVRDRRWFENLKSHRIKRVERVLFKSNSLKLNNLQELEAIRDFKETEKCKPFIPINLNQDDNIKGWWIRDKIISKSGEKIKATAIYETDSVYTFSFEMKKGIEIVEILGKEFTRKDTLNYLREKVSVLSFKVSPPIDSVNFLFKMPNVSKSEIVSSDDLKISFYVKPTKLSVILVKLSRIKYNLLFPEKYRWRYIKYKEGSLVYKIFFFVFTNPIYVFIIIVPILYFLGLKLKKVQNRFYEKRNKKSK